MKLAKRLSVAVLAASFFLCPQSYSCGPFFDQAYFSFERHPDFPLKFYANGKLGIIQPGFARSYLLAAYRELIGKPLTPFEQRSIEEIWMTRLTNGDGPASDSPDAATNWLTARNKIPGFKKIDRISTDRATTMTDEDQYNQYLNCPGDAFKSATTTLNQKVTKYGASSDAVKSWLTAQDLVFCHCSGPEYKYDAKKWDPEPAFPQPVPATADAASKADRSYQIASANFYAQKFDVAAREFDAIAKDETSPYNQIAPYLAARCMIRKGTLPKKIDLTALQAATDRLKEIIGNNKTASEIRQASTQLLTFIAVRHFPDATTQALSKSLANPQTNGNFKQEAIDYTYLLDRYVGNSSDDDSPAIVKIGTVPKSALTDMTEWIITMQSTEPAVAQIALQKWNETKSPAWLVNALVHAKHGDKETSDLVTAALNLPASSPAYLTARYEAVRVLSSEKDSARANKALDQVLSNKDLPPSARNLFLDQKSDLAAHLSDYWQNIVRTSAGAGNDADGVEVPDDLDKAEARNSWYVGPSAFTPDAANLLNKFVPLSELTSAPWTAWPTAQKSDYLQAIWTRAILLKDDKVVSLFTPLLAGQNPMLKKSLDEFKATTNVDQRNFLSTYILLTNPAMRPYITPGTPRTDKFNAISDYQDNWWCSTSQNGNQDSEPAKVTKAKPTFMNAAQLAQAAAEDKRLTAAGDGPNYLLKQLIAYAQKPGAKDSRLPEALYHAIRAPKFGCTDKTTTGLSKTAFNLMHKQFPGNPWTNKTKFWY